MTNRHGLKATYVIAVVWMTGASLVKADMDFVCTIKSSGGDYDTLSGWEAAIESNLTNAYSLVFSVSGIANGGIDDLKTCTGGSSGATGFFKHLLADQSACYVIQLRQLDYDAQTADFTVGERVTGAVSTATGVIRKDTDSGATGSLFLENVSGVFQDDETLTDGSGSADVNGTLSDTAFSSGETISQDDTPSKTVTFAGAAQQVGLAVAECYNDFGPGGLQDHLSNRDDPDTDINGWMTDSNHYIKIYTPLSERHTGVPGTGFRIWDNFNGGIIENKEAYTQIIGLEIENTRTEHSYTKGVALGEDSLIGECIVRSGNIRALKMNQRSKAKNCLVYDSPNGILCAGNPDGSFLFNCTVVGCSGNGVYGDQFGKKYWKNVLCYSNGTDFGAEQDVPRLYNCASSDNTADDFNGSGNLTNRTFSFVSIAGTNYHLAPRDVGARDLGLDLSDDPLCSFNSDMDGQIRPIGSTWDIGMDESPSLSGTVFRFR